MPTTDLSSSPPVYLHFLVQSITMINVVVLVNSARVVSIVLIIGLVFHAIIIDFAYFAQLHSCNMTETFLYWGHTVHMYSNMMSYDVFHKKK